MGENQKFRTVRGYQLLEQNKKALTPAMEDYLEMIYRNSLKEGYLRINTLSELLSVQASSATKMVQRLAGLGLIHYEKYGIIYLTESGRELGKFLLQRHGIIEDFMKLLGAGENSLIETELIEHNISVVTLKNMELFYRFFVSNPALQQQYERFKQLKGTMLEK